MPFTTFCTTKGCKGCSGQMEPYIDPKTDQVFCSLCENELTHLTYFAKQQMKSCKQYKAKQTVSFMVKCQSCGMEDRPKLVGRGKKTEVVCPSCDKPHKHLSEPFKLMLREKLKTAGLDV